MSSDPGVFDDSEPEDAWHPDDAIPVLIDNLLRRCALLERTYSTIDRYVMLDDIERRLTRASYRNNLDERDHTRIEQTRDDVAYIRGLL